MDFAPGYQDHCARYGPDVRNALAAKRTRGSRERYESAFGARVRFGRQTALLRIPKSLISVRLDGVDETLRTLAMTYLALQPHQPGPVVAGQVRGVLDQSLGTGSTDLADVARVLAVHPRTLQRRLAAEGESFASILDGVRRAHARIYLTTTDLPLSQVASLVGFSEQAVLTRCAWRWWGRPPSALRREPRAGDQSHTRESKLD